MHKLYALVLLLLFVGCSLSGDEEIVVSTVQPELRLDLANPLELDTDFALRFTTTDKACSTAELLAHGIVQGNRVRAEVSGLLLPSECTSEDVVIGKDLEFGLDDGTYLVEITLGEELNNFGNLTFDGREYVLNLDDPQGIVIGHDRLKKIPEQIVWGEITSDTSITDIVNDFTALTAPLIRPFSLESGYYGHFTIEDGSGFNISSETSESNGYVYPFIFRLKVDTDTFRGVLDSFRNQYPDNLKITCTTWTGQQL